MKTGLMTVAIITALATSPVALADKSRHHRGDSYTDTARVTHVEPIYRMVNVSHPRRECWQEEVYRPPRHNARGDNAALGMIAGGVIGGALGHNIKHGSDSATIAGAIIGSAIGHDAARHRPRHRGGHRGYEERCNTVNEYHKEERVEGYRVTYRYRGKTFTTRMDEDPGDHIRIRVSVKPVRY